MQPACTAGITVSSFTSQNYGAGKYSRIKDGLKVCISIALISYLLLGSVMFFFPETISKLMLTGDEPIALAAEYLPICGSMLFLVNLLFVFRSAVQGMGKPVIPMISGIIEMFMRISVIVIFIGSFGFKATAYADVVAWIGAVTLNGFAYKVLINKYMNKSVKRKIKSKRILSLSKI